MKVRELIDRLRLMPQEYDVVVDVSSTEIVDGEAVEMEGFEGERVVRGVCGITEGSEPHFPFVFIEGAHFHAPEDVANR